MKKQKLLSERIQKWSGDKSKGLSILISVVLISLIVLFSIGVTTLVTESTRQSANVKQGTTAYYAAEAGIEQALWVNQKLASNGESIGADEKISQQTIGGAVTTTKYKIQGTTANLVEKTVNGQYIIPFPWTGNVPWHGEGAIAGSGGCNPEKPPLRSGSGASKFFAYPAGTVPADKPEIDHPCNWGRLKVGEKVVIPLFGKGSGGAVNFTAFTLKLRAPCKDDKEFCIAADRMEINCFDKGTVEKRCTSGDTIATKQWKKGEVIVSWELDGDNGSSLLQKQSLNDVNGNYYADDSQLYEGKINMAKNNASALYEVLKETADGILGGDIGTVKTINTFLTDSTIQKPVLKISVVGSLVGCKNGKDCNFSYDSPDDGEIPPTKNLNYLGPFGIPYLEYQVVLPSSAATTPPANLENVISAEGQSGPFNQTIQVKVPNDNSTLEYVIQQ